MASCKRCVYDDRIPGISFDSEGICNYCRMHEQMEREYPTGKKGEEIFAKIAEQIKADGKGRKYDCVVGVSGGCDSSYLVYTAKKFGLRPLAVHFDNTWNSSIATDNIRRVLTKLDVDLFTYVIDNEEFDDMARSFLDASVPEIDALSDIALAATMYLAAEKHGIKYILEGHNFRTEGMTPLGWFYFDGKYVSDIHKKFGKREMKTYPNLWFSKWIKWLTIDRIKKIRPLYYMDFDKAEVKKFLSSEYGWKWYGGHHMENKYSLLCDNYVMPLKFGIDLRYVEFSALIRSGQMTRKDALEQLKTPPEMDSDALEEAKHRLGYTDEAWEKMMAAPKKSAADYETYHPLFKAMRPFFWLMYKTDFVTKSFYVKYCK